MECVNCNEGFNMINRIPRLLTNCGHSICETCLMQFWNHQEYVYICKACLTSNKAETLSLFPKNLAILSLTQFNTSVNNQNFYKSANANNVASQDQFQRDFSTQSIHSVNLSHNQSLQQFYQPNQSINQMLHHQIQNSQNIGRFSLSNLTNGVANSGSTSNSNGQLKSVQVQLIAENISDLKRDNSSSNLNNQNTCSNHFKQYEAFCLQDKQFLCIQCIIDANSTHKNHKIETIEKAVQMEVQELLNFQMFIDNKKKENVESLQKIESMKQEILVQEQKYSGIIVQFYNQIFQLIKERQQTYLDKLQSEKQSKLQQLDDLRSNIMDFIQKMNDYSSAKQKFDDQSSSLPQKQYLIKVKEIHAFKANISQSVDQLEAFKKNSKFLSTQQICLGFEFNRQQEVLGIYKVLDSNQAQQQEASTPNNSKGLTISLSKERIQQNQNNSSGSSNGKKKNSQSGQINLSNSNLQKKGFYNAQLKNQKSHMNESYNNTSLQHEISLNLQEKEKENITLQLQQPQQRKHSKTLQATTLNQLIQPPTTTNQNNFNPYLINNNTNASNNQPQNNQIDFSKYKIEITNIKMVNRQASQPKKQNQAADIPTFKKENINTLNIITNQQNDKQTKETLYLENRSNKNLLSSKNSSTNHSTKNVNTLKYKSLRSQNPYNIQTTASTLSNTQINERGNSSSSIDKMKVLRGSTTETVKNAARHATSVNNQFISKPAPLTNITTDGYNNNIYNEKDLQTNRTIDSNKNIDFDSERNIIDTVKIDFSSLASQKRQFILTIGGFTEKQQQSLCMEKLDLQNTQWEPFTTQSNFKSRVKFGSVIYKQKKVIIFGGKQEGKRLDTFEEIDTQTKESKLFPGIRLSKPKSGFAFTQISDEEIIVVGGNDGQNILSDAEIYNLNTKQIRKLQPLSFARDELAIALSNDKKYIYAFGGYSQSLKNSLNIVEKYDIQKNKWETVKPMNQCRRSLQVVTLPDGFYILGGFDGQNYLSSVEKYDDANDQWVLIQNMLVPRATFSALKSPDNMGIIVLGGFNNQPLQLCEKYSIFKGAWEPFPSLNQKRFMHSSIIFGNNSSMYY
ncbi:hypothetical protein ABPG74_012358 [Tetrahymena malaccensis]